MIKLKLKGISLLLIFFCCQPISASSVLPCKTTRTSYLNNNQVRVWATDLCPHEKLPFHTHQTARVVISDQNGMLKVIYKDGKTQYIPLKKDVPVFLSKEQGKKPHEDLNAGDKKLRMLVLSIK